MNSNKIDLSEILIKYLGAASIRGEVPLDVELSSLGLDSMSAINLLLDIEERFQLVFPDELLNEETFRTRRTLESAVGTLA